MRHHLRRRVSLEHLSDAVSRAFESSGEARSRDGVRVDDVSFHQALLRVARGDGDGARANVTHFQAFQRRLQLRLDEQQRGEVRLHVGLRVGPRVGRGRRARRRAQGIHEGEVLREEILLHGAPVAGEGVGGVAERDERGGRGTGRWGRGGIGLGGASAEDAAARDGLGSLHRFDGVEAGGAGLL